MGAEKRPTQDHPDPPPPPPHQVTKIVDPPPPEPAAQRLENVEKRMSAFERSTLFWAKAAVGVAVIAALFACLQWFVMTKTLNEMKTSGDVTARQTWKAIDNLNWVARSMDESAKQTQGLVAANQKMAMDNGNLLQGTQAAFMTFSVSSDIPSNTVIFSARNTNGKAQARDLRADLTATIRNWPSKTILLGPFHDLIYRKRVGGLMEPGVDSPVNEHFTIPKITPEVAAKLSAGDAYITVQYRANYDNGFGTRIYSTDKQSCDAYMYIGHVRCQPGPGSIIDNDIRGHDTCENIETLRKKLEQWMSDSQKQCQKPK